MFDPEVNGTGAIKGGCSRCQELQAIFANHKRTLLLMQAFAPFPTKRAKATEPSLDRQQDLFPPLP